jgi:hypothetical protein
MRAIMKLLAAFAVLAAPAVAHAQVADDDGGRTGGPTPTWTQDRTFPGTRFWKLDKGKFEVEQWWKYRAPPRGSTGEDAYQFLQTEIEMGITDRVQIDIYENVSTEGTGRLHHDGNQIEARIAIDPVYGRTPGNPVIYLEWQPRHLQGDRAEVRLLGGGEMLGDRLVGAANLFYEQNLTSQPGAMGGSEFVPNPEMGATGGLSYAIMGQTLRVGGEAKLAFEKELLSDPSWQFQVLVGPNVSARLHGERLKLFATSLFGLTSDARKVDAALILASEF